MKTGINQNGYACGCGCCEGVQASTPALVDNAPGLNAIAYRVGTHSRFKASMLAKLSNADQPYLKGLTTRSDDDLAIALLDGWAVVADIISFYQERIANESYLRTATERLSLLELARSIGYELRPGVAASTRLAFMIDGAQGAPPATTVPAGTQVQSIPGPGEQAQTFETSEPIPARVAWNAMTPRLATRHTYYEDGELRRRFYIAGTAANLKAGDVLILNLEDSDGMESKPILCQILGCEVQYEHKRTQVELIKIVTASPQYAFAIKDFTLNKGNSTKTSPQSNVGSIMTIDSSFARQSSFNHHVKVQPPPPGVIAFRMKASIFGHNAPKIEMLPPGVQPTIPWVDKVTLAHAAASGYNGAVDLDSVYASITPESYVVLRDGMDDAWSLHEVLATREVTVAEYAMSGKVTRLTLDNNDDFDKFMLRTTTVYAQNESLALARLPITEPIAGNQLDLEGMIDGLYQGQGLIVQGELHQNLGNSESEYVTIQDVAYKFEDEGFTRITLAGTGLLNAYVRTSVTINGNVAPATHGQTRQELLGSGDGAAIHQSFALRQSPLTHISIAGPSGTQSTLQLYVGDMLWHEVSDFNTSGPTDRVFITRRDAEGNTTAVFGDGVSGARLNSGQHNVRAVYRTGIGTAGNVREDKLKLLLSRPAGVKEVTNPIHASGAADPETLEDAKSNAPTTVLTLGRIVSLRDYENFARAFVGIGKALATWSWDGRRRGVFVTIAGAQGAEVRQSDALYSNLITAIRQAGDPYVPIRVQTYQQRFFSLGAVVKVATDHVPDIVRQAIEIKLRAAFSFESRAFGQSVFLSEVLACMQEVPGVAAVRLQSLYRSYPVGPDASGVHNVIIAGMPHSGAGVGTSAAELLTLDPRPLDLIMTVSSKGGA